jgi:hypothetical protein
MEQHEYKYTGFKPGQLLCGSNFYCVFSTRFFLWKRRRVLGRWRRWGRRGWVVSALSKDRREVKIIIKA